MFIKDSGSVKINLKICPSGRNEGLMMVLVDQSSKLPLLDGGGQSKDGNKQVGGNRFAFEKP